MTKDDIIAALYAIDNADDLEDIINVARSLRGILIDIEHDDYLKWFDGIDDGSDSYDWYDEHGWMTTYDDSWMLNDEETVIINGVRKVVCA